MCTLCSKQRIKWKSVSRHHQKMNLVTTWVCCVFVKKKNIQATSQLKAFLTGERQKRKGYGWQRKLGDNGDGDLGDGVKRYKPGNAESIVVFCQADGFKLRLKSSFSENSFHSHHCQHLWLPREGGGTAFVREREKRGRECRKKMSINLLEIWPEFTACFAGKHPLCSSAQPWYCV